jgi:hypothetical protein
MKSKPNLPKGVSDLNLSERDIEKIIEISFNPPELTDTIKERFLKSLDAWNRMELGGNHEIHNNSPQD